MLIGVRSRAKSATLADTRTQSSWLGLVLILICLPLLLPALEVYPRPWYDEGYSMQVSRLLVEDGFYGTWLMGKSSAMMIN